MDKKIKFSSSVLSSVIAVLSVVHSSFLFGTDLCSLAPQETQVSAYRDLWHPISALFVNYAQILYP